MSLPRRLDIGKVIVGAFLVPWWHRKAFLRALAIPLGLLVGFTVLWYYVAVPYLPQYTLWLLWALHGALFTLFAVTCHRLVLLDADAIGQRWLPMWVLVAVNLWMRVFGDIADWFQYLTLALKLSMLYVLGRLCLVFPATALDLWPSARWSWNLTRGNGWRLLVIVGGLPFAVSYVISVLYRSEATTVEWLMLTVVGFALLAVEIAAISISYRELTASANRDEIGL